jgi:hypothetical protein
LRLASQQPTLTGHPSDQSLHRGISAVPFEETDETEEKKKPSHSGTPGSGSTKTSCTLRPSKHALLVSTHITSLSPLSIPLHVLPAESAKALGPLSAALWLSHKRFLGVWRLAFPLPSNDVIPSLTLHPRFSLHPCVSCVSTLYPAPRPISVLVHLSSSNPLIQPTYVSRSVNPVASRVSQSSGNNDTTVPARRVHRYPKVQKAKNTTILRGIAGGTLASTRCLSVNTWPVILAMRYALIPPFYIAELCQLGEKSSS